jgi:hypothetical protein
MRIVTSQIMVSCAQAQAHERLHVCGPASRLCCCTPQEIAWRRRRRRRQSVLLRTRVHLHPPDCFEPGAAAAALPVDSYAERRRLQNHAADGQWKVQERERAVSRQKVRLQGA